jgi:hypothetical protein
MDIKKLLKWVAKVAGALFLLPMVLIGVLVLYWDMRTPPSFAADPSLKLETWTAIPSGSDKHRFHKSNTDMIFYKDSFFLIHASTKWHLQDKNGVLLVQKSSDAMNWKEVARINVPGTDVRDPKFAIIKGRLFLYFLPNWKFDPDPPTTYWSVSDDGVNWQAPMELTTVKVLQKTKSGKQQEITGGGWRLWRPKTLDGAIWYVIAFGKKPILSDAGGKEWNAYVDTNTITVLVSSTDGVNWREVSEIYTAHGNGEPELEFMENGSIIATLRCGSLGTEGYAFGNPTANTIIATADPPYTKWSFAHSFITRLDGSTMFPLGGHIFSAGRNTLGPRIDNGNHLAKKRTAIYEVRRDKLIFLFNLPSNGDTSYTGVVRRGDDIYVSYYTCPVNKDYPWILGICFFPRTEIRIAKMSAAGLLDYAGRVAQ